MRIKELTLNGKVAIVTGGGQGIGEGIAMRLAEEGARIVLVDLNLEAAEKVVGKLEGNNECFALRCDVSIATQVQDMVETIIGKFGRIDILVNNAGITRDALLKDMTEDMFNMALNVNLKGVWLCIKHVAPYMAEQRYGKIVNISSRAASGAVAQSNYSAAKAGVVGLTRSIALEFAHLNINVNAVSPGFVYTPLTCAYDQNIIDRKVETTPLRRGGKPDDIANAVLFLASDEASFITGQTLNVCGGRSLYALDM